MPVAYPKNTQKLLMNLDNIIDLMKDNRGLESNLGMEFFSTPEADECCGRMPVDERTSQPFGYLSGGATLALAETLAGAGSLALCPGEICFGMNVSANHLRSVEKGDTVTARARIIHQGHRIHVWIVEVRSSDNTLISTVTVTNYIRSKK